MRYPSIFIPLFLFVLAVLSSAAAADCSVQGILDLVQRRLPQHADQFAFELRNASATSDTTLDEYAVSDDNGVVKIEGNSLSALASGLHRYLTDVAHVDIWWSVGSRLHLAPAVLPPVVTPIEGKSVVPWRYHFNTVTFSYTTAWWTWEEWELELDWLALRGVNLPLAWVGMEKILIDVFTEIGLTEPEIYAFLSGPAFQAWNRLGNIQGSWGGDLPKAWVEGQFELQKKIVRRMVELGMTPILPAFTGFVPQAISRVAPNATTVRASQWNGFPERYTNDTFLEPTDPLFSQLQESFIKKQIQAYGNVTHFYALDQYNENDPASGDLEYLRNVTYNTHQSLKAADEDAVWVMQGWLFFSSEDFWTNERIEAYLSGVEEPDDFLILDLFSESQPQWQRTNSYFGKPWIWCQLHDYGGNMGLYGQVENITKNPIKALGNSSSLVGFGLTMEGQEGNEIVYDLLLDQAWSGSPIDVETYFHDWVTRRYANNTPSADLYAAWDILRVTAYNNTNLTTALAVYKSIFELSPRLSGLVDRTGHHPTNIPYDPALLRQAWEHLIAAGGADGTLYANPAYAYDLVDVTRQVLSNVFVALYTDLVQLYNGSETTSNSNSTTTTTTTTLHAHGTKLLDLLTDLDAVLATNPAFRLDTWLAAARAWAGSDNDNAAHTTTTTDLYTYNARNQITLWGPDGEISDYASKSWAGLVSGYYRPRWRIFLGYLERVGVWAYNETELEGELGVFEEGWQWGNGTVEDGGEATGMGMERELREVVGGLVGKW